MDYAYGNEGVGGAAVQICPNCGNPVNAGDAFCIMCGVELGGMQHMDSNERKPMGYCEQCGSQLFEGDMFCTSCATPISANVPDSGPVIGTRMVEPGIDKGQTGGSVPQTPSGTGTLVAGLEDYSPYQDTALSYSAPSGKPVLAVPATNNDHPTARPKSVRITREEAKAGCRKTVVVDGQSIEVEIPGGVGVYTKLDVPGLGYFDQMTGERGPLRLSFHIV